jgi:hypothetical protein
MYDFLLRTIKFNDILIVAITLSSIFLYAEIHYRLPLLKGIIFRKQPEIIFDAPYRVQSDFIPVMLLIKDAHLFPVEIEKIRFNLYESNSQKLLNKFYFNEKLNITQKWFSKIYNLDVGQFRNILIEVECIAQVKIGKKTLLVKNDNYPNLSHNNLKSFIDSEGLPLPDEWICGDLHCHSAWTEDQVEFGIPIENIEHLAKPMGISFCAVADHSYDLDDFPNSWRKNDSSLTKWKQSRETINHLNEKSKQFLLIPGEEASVDNGLGQNVHMVILNNSKFIEGTGDSLDVLFKSKPEHYYAKVLDKLPENAMAFAAHPSVAPPPLQKLLIRRGIWNIWDSHRRLSGFQIMNGVNGEEIKLGKDLWRKRLLNERKMYIYAGNDSHGNLNRFRQVRIPLVKLYERNDQIFGRHLTYVKSTIEKGVNSLVNDLKCSPLIISTGPFVNISIDGKSKPNVSIGETLLESPSKVKIFAKSNSLFGKIKNMDIILGNLKNKKEYIIKSFNNLIYERKITFLVKDLPEKGYFRSEIYTDKSEFALTNPVWFDKIL